MTLTAWLGRFYINYSFSNQSLIDRQWQTSDCIIATIKYLQVFDVALKLDDAPFGDTFARYILLNPHQSVHISICIYVKTERIAQRVLIVEKHTLKTIEIKDHL